MQFIIFSLVKFYLAASLLLISLNQSQFAHGLTTFSSFLGNLDATQEDLANLQHSSPNGQYNTESGAGVERTCEELQSCDDQAGYEAIKWLHRQLDDDSDGNVDMHESADFIKDFNHSDPGEKQLQFHGNDKHISIDDLWLYWLRSEVHNYTVDQVVDWLISSVELGQYEDAFRANSINGTSFPRLASSQSTFLSATLGIKDSIHKQKIALKAMDLVLFGPPKSHNYFKDLLLVFSFLVAMLGCCYAALQRKNSQNHLKKMLRDMEALQNAENQLSSLQMELYQAKREQEAVKTEKIRLEENLLKEGSYPHFYLRDQSLPNVGELNKICELEEELRQSKEHVARLEQALEEKKWAPPSKLQYWLQFTHELELKNHNAKRQAAELQLALAKEGCEKLKKKRSSFLGSFRVAHGTSIDDVDSRILQAKESLAEVTKDLQERLYRWKQIEQICNFTIQTNKGEGFLQSELYKQLIAGGKLNPHQWLNSSLHSNSMPRTGSEGTLIESEDGFSAHSNPIGFSTVQQLFQNSFALMTIPGLDTAVYGHINPALLGNEHDRYFDARDQYAAKYLTPNQLAGLDNSSKPSKLATNPLAANAQSNHPIGSVNRAQSNHLTAGPANPLTKPTDRKSSLRLKLKSGDLRRLLKRRYSENVIGNLPVNDKMTNHSPTMPNLSSNMNISNLHYRLHPVLNSDKLPKPYSHSKNINMLDKKPTQNGICDEDSTTSEENSEKHVERKPQFELGEVALKENVGARVVHRMNGQDKKVNGKSSHPPELTNHHKEEDELNNTGNDSDYISSIDQSRTSNADLTKATKKRKSYKFFSGLRKRGSKYSSQESH